MMKSFWSLILFCISSLLGAAESSYYVERLFWEEARQKEGWNVVAKIVEDQSGMVVKCITYTYNLFDQPLAEYSGNGLSISQRRFFEYDYDGKLIAILTDNGVATDKDDREGVTESYVSLITDTLAESPLIEKENYFYEYNATGQKVAETDSLGNITTYCYDEWDRLITITFFPAIKEESPKIHSEHPSIDPNAENSGYLSYVWTRVKNVASSIADTMNRLKAQLSYTTHQQQEWDDLAEQVMGKGFLQFAGYYLFPIEKGSSSYGEEVHDKVRVTFINGILNIRQDLEESLKLFSSSHGDIPIHYVYRPTEGWTKDILSSTLSKLGYASPYAKLLAQTWREMIHEMGGVGEGGKILHYAHSIGATDTYIAGSLLRPEEQQMIHVISLGSPTMISQDSGFGSVVNYVSKRDGVCLLDPVGYVTGYLSGDNIELIGSVWGIPLIDHTLYTDSYGGMIQEQGKEFLKQHSL